MPGGWGNSLRERWVSRPSIGLSNFAQNATVKAIIEDRLFTAATDRPAPTGDRLYFHNVALQFAGGWVKSPQSAHYYPGDVAVASDGALLLAEVTQDASASNRYLPQIIKVDNSGTIQASAFMTDSLGSAFSIYTTDMRVASGTAGYVFCANSSEQSSTTRVPVMYALSADLTTLLWSASALGGTTDRIHDVRAAGDGNSAFFSGTYYYTNRFTGICYKIDNTGALLRSWVIDQVASAKHCMIFNSAEDASGNLYLFGLTNGGTVEGSFIVKFNTANTAAWKICLGGNPYSKSWGFLVSTGNLYQAQSDWSSGIMLSKVTSAGTVTSQTRLYDASATLFLMAFASDGADGAYLLLRAIDTTDFIVLLRVDSSFSILWQIKLTPLSMASFQSYPSGGLSIDSSYVYVSIPQLYLHMKVSKDGMGATTLDAGGTHETAVTASSLLTQTGSTTITTLTFAADSVTSFSLSAGPSGFAVRSSGFTPDTGNISGLTVTGEPRASQVDGARFPGGFTVASSGVYKMDRSAGPAQVARSFSSIASAADRQGVLFGVYASDPLNAAQWIGDGDATLFIADAVSNAAMDFTAGSPEVYVWRPSTYQRVGTLYNAASARMGTPSTSEKVTAARFRPCPIYALVGDIIVVELWGQVVSTGHPSYNGTAYFDGTTINDTDNAPVSNYAANIRFSETLTFNVASQTYEVAHAATANATDTQVGSVVATLDQSESAAAIAAHDGNRAMSGDASATASSGDVAAAVAAFGPAQSELATAIANVTGGAIIDGGRSEPAAAIASPDFSSGQFAVRDEPAAASSAGNALAVFVADGSGSTASDSTQMATMAMPVSITSSATPATVQDVSAAFGPSIAEAVASATTQDSEFKLGGIASEPATASSTQNGIGAMGVSVTGGDGDPRMGTVMLLMHMEGENLGKETIELNGHAVTFIAQAEMSTAHKKFGTSSAYFPSMGGAISIAKDGQFVFPADFTFEGWAKLEVENTNQGIALFANGFMLKASGAFAGYFTVKCGTSETTHQTIMPTGVFFHWAVVRKDGQIVIFLNGVKSTATPMDYATTVEALAGGLILGSWGQYGEAPLGGWLDEVRFSRFARYTATFTPPAAPFPDHAYTGAEASELTMAGGQVPAEQTAIAAATDTGVVTKMRYAVFVAESIGASSSTDATQITGTLIGTQVESCFASAVVTSAGLSSIDASVTESVSADTLQRAGYTVQAIVQAVPLDATNAGINRSLSVSEQVISLESAGATIQFVVSSYGQAVAEASISATAVRKAAASEAVKALSIIVAQILGESGADQGRLYVLQQAADLFVGREQATITVMTKQDCLTVKE